MAAKQTKFITSHRDRVARANEFVRKSPEKMSLIDREAVVEFYLLEDIERLLEYRLQTEQQTVYQTRAGQLAQSRKIAKYTAAINVFRSMIEVSISQIHDGQYKDVWSNIPEHALMFAAGNTKNLKKLCEMAPKSLRDIFDDANEAIEMHEGLQEALDELEDHDKNVRTVKGMPTNDDLTGTLNEMKEVVEPITKTSINIGANNKKSSLLDS